MLCQFERTGDPNTLRCSKCGFVGAFAFGPEQVRRPCDVIDLHAEASREVYRGTSCRFLGAETGTEDCRGCRGRVRIKQFQCHHPAHETTTLASCSSCIDYQANPVPRGEHKRMLIRFPHGFGDAVQLTVVLRHLRAKFPRWRVSVAVKPGLDALFAGLADEVLPLDTPSSDFDLERILAWHEPTECYSDSAATKAEKCLREVFQIQPQAQFCKYHARPNERDVQTVAEFVELLDQDSNQRGFVLMHYQGNSARRQKNLPEEVIVNVCRRIKQNGFLPVLLDLDQRSKIRNRPESQATVLDASHWLWKGRGIGDAGIIAALADRATLCLGIDSGPGHLFAARQTPTIIVWTWHHPLHFFPPTEHVTHLVPLHHSRLLRGGNVLAGTSFFEQKYSHRCYSRLNLALPRLVEELLRQHAGKSIASKSEFPVMHCDLWVREDVSSDKAEIVRDYQNGRSAPDKPGRRPRVVLDLAAGIGAFAAALRERSSRTKILCWNPDLAAAEVLKANAGGFAEIVPPTADLNHLQHTMWSWLELQPHALDLVRYDAGCPISTQLAQDFVVAMRRKHCTRNSQGTENFRVG